VFKRLLDWVSVQEESPEEETANRAWLQIMILTALATTAFYAVLDWKKSLANRWWNLCSCGLAYTMLGCS